MKQSSKRNLTMVMDLYELTMANGYFNDGDKTARVAFDVFNRNICKIGIVGAVDLGVHYSKKGNGTDCRIY